MSRHRRQQLRRARGWQLEVRDTLFGWRAAWWLNGRERFKTHCFSRVENRFTSSRTGEHT